MKKIFFFCLALSAPFCSIAQIQRIYVQQNASGAQTGLSWNDAFSDLQAAIQVSKPGDTLWIAAGVYRPTATTDRAISFEPKSGTVLLGGFVGSESSADQRDWKVYLTILSGDIGTAGDSLDNSMCVVYLIEPDSSTVLDGLVIRDGLADSNSGTSTADRGRSGAGLYVMGKEAAAYPVIRNCKFEHNTARNFGGGVMVNGSNGGSVGPTFFRCAFVNNKGANGGGMARQGASWVERGIDWDSCTFIRNYASARGGGLYYNDTDGQDSTQVWHSQFIGNYAGISGGGAHFSLGRNGKTRFSIKSIVAIHNKSDSGTAFNFFTNFSLFDGIVALTDSKMDSNVMIGLAASSVLGMDLIATSSTTVLISNNSFTGNIIDRVTGVSCVGANLISNNNIFFNNVGNLIGDSDFDQVIVSESYFIANTSSILAFGSTPNKSIYQDCIFIGNSMGNNGCYFNLVRNSTLTARNCHFIGNSSTRFFCNFGNPTDTTTVYCINSIIYGDITTNLSYYYYFGNPGVPVYLYSCYFDHPVCTSQQLFVTCGPGNLIGLDPLFIAPDSGDYRLQPCSPLVNAGNNAYVSSTNTTDLASQPRIQGGNVDIGAYETAAPLLAALPAVQPACSNQPNGAVSLPVAGGCAPFSYQWATDSGQSGSGTSGLKFGAYTFTISDQRGSTFTVSLAVPDSSTVSLTSLTTPVQCGDTLGGTAIAHAIGGQPPYLFDWPGSLVMDSVQTDLPPGLYSVTVQDARGCTASAVAEVKKQGSLGSIVEVGEISCFGAADGSLTVLPVNGQPPYHWNWPDNPALDAPTLAPLGPGQYRVTLTDAFGCDIAWTLPLTQPAPLQVLQSVIDPATDSISADGSVSVTVAGGTAPYTAQWSNGSTGLSISGLKPDVYTLTLTDQHGCSFTATYMVDVISGTSEPGGFAGFSLLPNPTEAQVQVLLAEPAKTGSLLRVLDASGQLTGQWTLLAGTQQLRLDLGDLPVGMYWVQLRSERGTATRRVVKH